MEYFKACVLMLMIKRELALGCANPQFETRQELLGRFGPEKLLSRNSHRRARAFSGHNLPFCLLTR